jgi:DHA1 family tetracycline resistance protein-like MFS transporter
MVFEDYRQLAVTLWDTKTYRLLVIILIQLTGSLFLLPILPQLLTDDFATHRNDGVDVSCGDFSPSDAPEVCVRAHADVVQWSTISGFFQNAIFSILVSPTLGSWSDRHGRKPVILASQCLSVAPIAVLVLHVNGSMRLCWIYVVQAFTQSVSIIAPSLAYMSDKIESRHRAAAFGLIIASFSVAILIGPPIGSLIPLNMVPYATLLMLAVASGSTLLFLPESLPRPDAMDPSEGGRHGPKQGLMKAIGILTRNPLFIKLATILVITAAVGEGLQDLLIQYLQLRLGFGPSDVSKMFASLGLGALLVQGIFLQLLLRLLGETRLLFVGLFVGGLQQVVLVLAATKWQAIAAVAMGSLGSVTFPTISSIKSNNSSPQEQGAVQGALYGARALSSGIGPLIFGVLFRVFLVEFPGAPFVLGALGMFVACIIAWGIDQKRDVDTGGGIPESDWTGAAESASLLSHA